MLAAFLLTVAAEELSGHDRVVVLRAHQRMASHYQARVYADMAAIVEVFEDDDDDGLGWAVEAAAAEVRAALRLTRRSADTEVGMALELRDRLPVVWASMAAGDIDARRAWILVDGTIHLPVDVAREVIDQVIEVAPRLTTGQLAARLRRLCIDADPVDASRRYRKAADARRVTTEPTEAGTAHFHGLDLPPERVAAAARRIDALARSLVSGAETRSIDQLRADVFLDLLEGTGDHPVGGRGRVDITVDLATLSELANHPGDLAGYGPVVADIARRVAEHQRSAEWRWTLTHPDTGAALDSGVTRRRPTAGQRRAVEIANPKCVFPGCRMPAAACDLDHRIPWAQGGPTEVDNLVPLCRHDHAVRHRQGWAHRPLADGDHEWTTPLGHVHTTSGRSP